MDEQDTPDQSELQPPADISQLLARIRQNPETRRGFQAMSWFILVGGIIILVIGLTTPGHPNPYLLPSLVVIGIGSILSGAGMLLYLRRSRFAPWLMLLSIIIILIFIYYLVRVFTYSH
jgi:uncharacterized membrane protein HdeD (DUF308 family)